MKEIIIIVKKYDFRLCSDEKGDFFVGKCPDVGDMEFVRKNKEEITAFLRGERESEKQEEIRKEEGRNEEYLSLEGKLPERKIETTENDEIAKEFIQKAESLRYYEGEEDEGLNIAISSGKNRLYHEAQKHCRHELVYDIYRTYTIDARKEIQRTIKCKKCKLFLRDVVAEKLSIDTIVSC